MKTLLILCFKLLTSGALLLYLFTFSGIVSIQEVINTIQETRLSIFIAVFFIGICNVFITAKRWSLLLHDEVKYSRLVSLCFIGYFFSTFLPGRIAGDFVKTYYLYKDTGKGGISIASVLMDRYMGLSAIIGISVIALFGGYTHFRGSDIEWFIPLVCVFFLMASFIFWRVDWGKITFFNALYATISEYRTNKRIICNALLLSLVIQVLCIIEVYLLSLAIGLSVPIIYFFIFVPIINAITTIPVTVAGLGVREVGFSSLFNMFFIKLGVTSAQAVSLSLLTFSIMILVNLAGGIEYVRIRKLPEKESRRED